MYIYWPSKQGFVVTHSKKKFFTLSYRYLKALYKFVTRYNELRIEYHDAYDELTSKEFWEKQFYSKENKE